MKIVYIIAKVYYYLLWYLIFIPVSIYRRRTNRTIAGLSSDTKKTTWVSFSHKPDSSFTKKLIFWIELMLKPLLMMLYVNDLLKNRTRKKCKKDNTESEVSPFQYTMY